MAAGGEFYEAKFGPIVTARELLEPQGRRPALRAGLRAFFQRRLTGAPGTMALPVEYLVVLDDLPPFISGVQRAADRVELGLEVVLST